MISRNTTKVLDILILAIYSNPDIDKNNQAEHTQKLIKWFKNTDWNGTIILYWFSLESFLWKPDFSLIDEELAKIIRGFDYLLYTTCEFGDNLMYYTTIATTSVFREQEWINNSQTNITLMGDSLAVSHVEKELEKAGISPLQITKEKDCIF